MTRLALKRLQKRAFQTAVLGYITNTIIAEFSGARNMQVCVNANMAAQAKVPT